MQTDSTLTRPTEKPEFEFHGLPVTDEHRKRWGKESPRMFGPDWMEYFSHVHPAMPFIVWAPVAVVLFWRAATGGTLTLGQVGGAGALGIFIWTLSEWVLHRYLFHFKPFGKWSARLAFMIHGVHHDAPNDATRLVMPPVAALVLAAILYPLFLLIFGAVWAPPVFGGFLIGYMVYDYTHFAVHHFRMRTSWGRMLKEHHMKHHFVTPELRWGVSSPIWDWVFGTSGK